MKQRLSLIWAMTANRVIGKDGHLAWDLPDELAYYLRTTAGKPIIMGRRTYESVNRPRLGQLNIVLSRSAFRAEGVVTARNLDEALAAAADDPSDEVFVTGGAEPYKLALPRADRLYATTIHAELDGDTFFPPFDFAGWTVVRRCRHPVDARHAHAYDIEVYERGR